MRTIVFVVDRYIKSAWFIKAPMDSDPLIFSADSECCAYMLSPASRYTHKQRRQHV